MIKRYSFATEQQAKELILGLGLEPNQTTSKDIQGIVLLGFQDKYKFNEDTQESELVKKGLTYDLDIMWRNEPNKDWLKFEVTPKTPNHKFMK